MASASDPNECLRDPTKELVATLQNELKRVQKPPNKPQHEPCIYRVPRRLGKANDDAYTPQVVSIGPYHRGLKSLQALEEFKLRYLSDFLNRKSNNSLEYYVQDLRKIEESARQCYGEIIPEESNDFVKMLLLDGCFIIELFSKHQGCTAIKGMIEGDLLLLENQLPFFILERLFNGRDPSYRGDTFLQLTLDFFQIHKDLGRDFATDSHRQILHFVDLIRQCYLSSSSRPIQSQANETFTSIPNATELHESGVKFRKSSGNCFLDLKFINGVFEIPTLIVEDRTELLLRNLIAFEQCSAVDHAYITHYAILMDFLINSPNDVAVLRGYGVIDNWIGDNEQVSHLFNNICSGVITSSNKNYFYRLSEDVNAYYNTPWHAFQALLERDYFNSPWSIMSCIAVFIVLVCTIVQTVCSVISLKSSPSI